MLAIFLSNLRTAYRFPLREYSLFLAVTRVALFAAFPDILSSRREFSTIVFLPLNDVKITLVYPCIRGVSGFVYLDKNRFEKVDWRNTRKRGNRRTLLTVYVFHCTYIHKYSNGEFSSGSDSFQRGSEFTQFPSSVSNRLWQRSHANFRF